MEELLSLKWNNHRSTFLHILTILRDKQLYTDATLACEGRFYSVHRLVLSTCSDYFSAMFDRTTCKNPIIVLKDIKCEDLEALLDYMYLGEVNVRQADLASLIKAAECLRVKGLAVPDDEPPHKRGRGDTSNLRRSDGPGSPPSKRKRRDEGQDGREDIRPTGGGGGSSRPKTPQSQSRLSPVPSQQDGTDLKANNRLQGSSDLSQGNNASDTPFVKVEMEDTGGDDLGTSGDTFNINSDGYKEEEPDNDAGDPGGNLNNDLPEFLQQATGSHMGGTSFGHGSFPASSSYQSDDLTWQGEGSNLNFPGHLNYSSPTDSSSQNAPGNEQSLKTSDPNPNSFRMNPDQFLYPEPNSSDEFRKHPDTDSEEYRKYPCKLCGKKFYKKWNLQQHIRTHTGERPFSCPYCSYSACQNITLRNHITAIHGDV